MPRQSAKQINTLAMNRYMVTRQDPRHQRFRQCLPAQTKASRPTHATHPTSNTPTAANHASHGRWHRWSGLKRASDVSDHRKWSELSEPLISIGVSIRYKVTDVCANPIPHRKISIEASNDRPQTPASAGSVAHHRQGKFAMRNYDDLVGPRGRTVDRRLQRHRNPARR